MSVAHDQITQKFNDGLRKALRSGTGCELLEELVEDAVRDARKDKQDNYFADPRLTVFAETVVLTVLDRLFPVISDLLAGEALAAAVGLVGNTPDSRNL